MNALQTIGWGLVLLIALQHLYFLWLEMFAWTTRGPKVFRTLPSHLFEPTRKLAANQGLYNGFLAAGLIWSALIQEEAWSLRIAAFFLVCVALAGSYGGISVHRKIFFVQGIPALLALLFLLAPLLLK